MTEFAKPDDRSPSSGMGSGSENHHHVNGMSNGHSATSNGGGEEAGTGSGSEKVSKSSSSSSGHRSSSSSHKSSSKDKDRHRDKDRDHHRSSSSHKSSSSSSSSHKSSHKDKSRDKERSSSSSHKSSSRDKDRDREKSSSSGKDKERSSSSSGGHKSSSSKSSSSSSKDKDHHKSSSSSSSSKEKSSSSHHHSSSSSSSKKHKDKDKERSRDKDKERSRDKDRDRKDGDRKREKTEAGEGPVPATTNGHAADMNGSNVMEKTTPNNVSISMNAAPEYVNESFKPQVKIERMDVSLASSCDYSMSQFREDEQSFVAKKELSENDDEEDDEEEEEEDVPLFKRKRADGPKPVIKKEEDEDYNEEDNDPTTTNMDDEDDDDDVPLTARKKVKAEKKTAKKEKKKKKRGNDSDFEEEPKKKKVKKEKQQPQQIKEEVSPTKTGRKKKGDEEEEEVWKWWEEKKREDGVKWETLEHKGPVFAPEYERLPKNVRFEYDGRTVELSQDAEEIATFYARMLDHDYTSKQVFNDNFFKDWRKSMTSKERELIKDLSKCNFRMMAAHFQAQSEANKNRTKEEKLKLKEHNEALIKEYGFCLIDGHKEKIGNFKIEPPGLFRGRGEHPKMGMVKRRVVAEDIMLNCSKNSKVPKPPPGRKWKEVRHDNTVTWLASWIENVQGQVKYIMLNPSSRLKGEKDWQKYETARRLDKTIDKIRATYKEEWKSKEMRIRQRAVALYFIDKLALRAGNEKDEDQADTVGCCSLRVEHIALHKELNGKENVVVFDFLGKDSIRYYNEVEVEKRVFKNLELFRENKKPGDDLFDRLNTVVMNEHLRELMDGLTAKVFRTYNASITLQRQLDELTEPNATVAEKLLQYNRANRAVAILCNHQRAVPKTHNKSMENLKEKIRNKRDQVSEAEAELKALNKEAKRGSTKDRLAADKKKKQLERLREQLQKLEIQETDKDENKTIALGTSKLNYLDPRISVAWCKKNGVPIEKIFNKTQRDKFRWAIDMAGPDYRF